MPSNAKYNGNLVSDIQSAYQTYITGAPVGKGGQYAVSAQQKYGYASIADAAAGYLQAAGIHILSNDTAPAGPASGTTGSADTLQPAPVVTTPANGTSAAGSATTDLNTLIGNQIQSLGNAFQQAFGNAVYEPPLQSQYYSGGVPSDYNITDPSQLAGYTSVPAMTPAPAPAPSGGGIGIGTILLLAIVGIGGYLLWRHYHHG